MSIEDKLSPELDELLKGFNVEITVGIHAEEGAQSHGDGLTTAEVGAFHEFGLGVPQRSFIRAYFDENMAQIEADQNAALGRILDGADPAIEAGRLGLKLESGIRERILGRIAPPLAPATRRGRGETAVPLVDTSQLLGSIRSKVTSLPP